MVLIFWILVKALWIVFIVINIIYLVKGFNVVYFVQIHFVVNVVSFKKLYIMLFVNNVIYNYLI